MVRIFYKTIFEDVMVAFDIPNLEHVLKHQTSGYERGIDFDTFFIRDTRVNHPSPTI